MKRLPSPRPCGKPRQWLPYPSKPGSGQPTAETPAIAGLMKTLHLQASSLAITCHSVGHSEQVLSPRPNQEPKDRAQHIGHRYSEHPQMSKSLGYFRPICKTR